MPDNSPYPLPAHAATIWTQGPNLWLVLGPTERDGKSNRITLPATESGLATALRILRDREHEGPLPIGSTVGSCDQALAVHLRRHQVWASPLCPHCKAEQRGFAAKSEPAKPKKYLDCRDLGDVKVRRINSKWTAAKESAKKAGEAPAIINKSLAELGL